MATNTSEIPYITNKNLNSDDSKNVLVVRFPNASWSYGGTPRQYTGYEEIEFFYVQIPSRANCKTAVPRAQAWRRRQQKKNNEE
jgi:hypothetical protein